LCAPGGGNGDAEGDVEGGRAHDVLHLCKELCTIQQIFATRNPAA
jgi:hypothetical protein